MKIPGITFSLEGSAGQTIKRDTCHQICPDRIFYVAGNTPGEIILR
ncbi:hypothetical protein A628_00501 [Salmonella enterica subsp. enterica serovar Cubana str. 76814]|uniref:Uncharacterized protein n=1 Tax=Salmonella enterica subsp. enterica serovar Cubana str. 76814 TaxID=1192560 RepID=V7ITV4_SALET|nr:hypothetical protein A628_00501 [Salmonella enterica subsp. enterica serovar Cubana str. 76814]